MKSAIACMMVLRPCAVRHKFRLCIGFTAGRPLGVPYGIAYRRWERKRSQIAKKYTANGLVRRGCPKPFWPVRCRPSGGAGRLPKRTAVAGQSVVRFGHTYSCMMVGFYEPRTTNHEPLFFHEPRVTRGDVFNLSLLPLSGIWIRGGLRPATCGLRGRQAPNSMNGLSPGRQALIYINVSLSFRKLD